MTGTKFCIETIIHRKIFKGYKFWEFFICMLNKLLGLVYAKDLQIKLHEMLLFFAIIFLCKCAINICIYNGSIKSHDHLRHKKLALGKKTTTTAVHS